MAKAKKVTVYFCQSCGYESSKWMGQCPGCREWNTFVEESIEKKAAGQLKAAPGGTAVSYTHLTLPTTSRV